MGTKRSRWSQEYFFINKPINSNDFPTLTFHLKCFESAAAELHLQSILSNTEVYKVINYPLLTKVVFSNNNVVAFVSIFS